MASATDIYGLLSDRRDFYAERNSRYDHMIKVWHGKLDELYPAEFPQEDLPKIANFAKLAWDSYAAMCGKVPDKVIRPAGLTDAAEKRASRIEQICAAYDEGSRIKLLTFIHFWYLVGLGSSVRGVVPNFSTKMPQFVVEDPRNCYPTPSFESTYVSRSDTQSVQGPTNPDNIDLRGARGGHRFEVWTGGALEDIIIEKRATVRALKGAFPGASLGPDTTDNLRRTLQVVQYFDRDEVVTLATFDKNPVELARAEHEIGSCPWRVTQTFAPDQVGGISQFEEQVSLLVAYSRILSQKLAFNDKSVWPITWIAGEVSSMRIGPHEVLKLDHDSKMGQLSPPTEFQADRDLGLLDHNIRTLNREGDPLRAEVQGGPITGRGLEQLLRPINTVVEHYWNIDSPDTEALYSYALACDEAYWPDEKKKIAGRMRGETFDISYVPSKDIAGHRDVAINYGFGVGGIEGFVQGLQAMGAEILDRDTVMESMPGVKSVSDTKRRIELDRLDKSIYAAFEQGDVPRSQFLAQLKNQVATGKPLAQAILEIPAPAPPEQAAPSGAAPGMLAPEQQAAALQAGAVAPQAQAPPLAQLLGAVG